MDNKLKKYRLGLLLVLGFYISMASLQPLLHAHTEEHATQVHAHLESESHSHAQADRSADSSHLHATENEIRVTGIGYPVSAHLHLAVDGSPVAAYHTAQQVFSIIVSVVLGLPAVSLPDLPPPLSRVTQNTDDNLLIPNKSYIITSLTDLSPPAA